MSLSNFDELLKHLGQFGRFQQFLLAVIAIPCMLCCWQSFLHAFLGYIPEHRCWIDGCDSDGSHYEEFWTNNTAPEEKVNGEYRPSACLHYNASYKMIKDYCISTPDFSNLTQKCERWKSSTEELRTTIATEWQLFCDDEWKVSMAGSINMAGGLIGVVLLGYIADRYGRKNGILLCTGLLAVFGVGAAFSPNVYVFAGMRFCVEAVEGSLYQILYVLVMEFTGPDKRVLASQFIQLIYSFGEVFLAGLAFLVREWHILQILTAAPSLLFLSYYWFLPESARWLISRGKSENANKILKQVASWNKGVFGEEMTVQYGTIHSSQSESEVSGEVLKDTELLVEDSPTNLTVCALFRTPRLRLRTLVIMLNWFLNVLVYTGVTLNSTALGNDAILTFFWTALVEIPANVLCIFTFDRLGRRLSLSSSFFLTGLPLIAMQFIPLSENSNWISVALSLIGKFGATVGNGVLYLFAAEIFPTVLRNSGLGICGFMGSAASIVAPQVILFGQYQENLPYIVFGIGSLVGGLSSLLLPETLKQKLPETVEEAENFGR